MVRVQPTWIGCGSLDCCFLISPEISFEKEDLCEHLTHSSELTWEPPAIRRAQVYVAITRTSADEVLGRGFLVKVQLSEPCAVCPTPTPMRGLRIIHL